jgi:hypothetical protein
MILVVPGVILAEFTILVSIVNFDIIINYYYYSSTTVVMDQRLLLGAGIAATIIVGVYIFTRVDRDHFSSVVGQECIQVCQMNYKSPDDIKTCGEACQEEFSEYKASPEWSNEYHGPYGTLF